MRFPMPLLPLCFTFVVVAAGCSRQAATPAAAPATETITAPAVGTATPPTNQPAQIEHGKPGTPQDPSTSEQPRTGEVVVPPGINPGAGGLTPTPALDQKIAKLERDGAAKKTLAAAYAERGTAHLNDDSAAPRAKYPAALKDFRRALQLDPTNADAKQSADTIVSIYKSMGRPVPAAQ